MTALRICVALALSFFTSNLAQSFQEFGPQLSAEQTLQVETTLFELGFTEVGFPDGTFSGATTAAITNYQRKYGLKETGFLTEEAFADLIATKPPADARWIGITVAPHGISMVSNGPTGIETYMQVLDKCLVDAVLPIACEPHVKLGTIEHPAWASAVVCEISVGSKTLFTGSVAFGDSETDAKLSARDNIERDESNIANATCSIEATFSSHSEEEFETNFNSETAPELDEKLKIPWGPGFDI